MNQPDKRKTGVRRSGQTSREQLLDVAAREFSLHGLHGVTLGQIAGRAGLSGPAIYNHFDSKDALFTEVVCRMYNDEIDEFRAILEPLCSVEEGLDALLKRVPKMYRGDGVMQMLGLTAQLEAARDSERFSEIADAVRRRDQVAIGLVRRAQEAGELPDSVDADELGALLMALFVGALGNRSLRAPNQGQFAHSVETFRGLFELVRGTRNKLLEL